MRKYIAVGGLLLMSVTAGSAGNTPLQDALQMVNSAQPGGASSIAQKRAWEVLAKTPADQITVLLAALDDATAVSANWISTAIDAVAERAGKEKLPRAELERFVLDRKHAPRGRSRAYELLSSVDAEAAKAMLPKFLDDPSVDLRRLAVASVLESAEQLAKKESGDKKAVVAEYQRAFDAARDQDQVDRAVEQLKRLGQTVDLQKHYGFIVDWQVIGPYDNKDKQGLMGIFKPEVGISKVGNYDPVTSIVGPGTSDEHKWQTYHTADDFGQVDLNTAIGKHMSAVAYAKTEFISSSERDAEIRIGTENAFRLWVNGKPLLTSEVYHSFSGMDQFTVPVRLKKGPNAVVMKVCQNDQKEEWAQGWKFQLRVCDAAGTAIVSEPEQK